MPPELVRLLANPEWITDEIERRSLSHFIRRAFSIVDPGTDYQHNWHVDLIAEYLEAVHRREILRLIINVPPGYLKSIAVNVAWPAWELGQNPSERIVSASYSDRLSVKHSVDCRLIVQSPWYQRLFPHVQLTGDQNEKTKFVTTSRGQRLATSVGGTATGDGGRILIVDDPINPRQAASETERENANTWFDQTFVSRLRDKKKGAIVVIMQRLHERDLTGHLLAKGGWTHLCLPAVAEQRTVLDFGRVKRTREEGELLHAEREGQKEIDRVKVELGSYGFAAQYQQRPAPAKDGIIQPAWFRRYRVRLEQYDQIIQSWDTAYKAAQHNDPSVCTTWGVTDTGYHLLDVWCERVEYPALKRAVQSQALKWEPSAILIEDKASGQSLLQDLRTEARLPLIAVTPEADKETRARAQSAQMEAGLVWLPEAAPWLLDYEQELMLFPNATHDDRVDSTTQFLKWIRSKTKSAGPRVRAL